MSYLEDRRKQKQGLAPPKEKKARKPIPKKSSKKIAEEVAEKEARGGEDTFLLKWHKARQKQLTGRCKRCGDQYNHLLLEEAVNANAHILPKAEFPSVELHPLNHIELSAYCGCHHWFDNQTTYEEKFSDPMIGEFVKERILMLETDLTMKERRRLPDVVRNLIESKNPFS